MKQEQIFMQAEHHTLHGFCWQIDEAKANVIIVTGMEEYVRRYDVFAKFLNDHQFSVYGLDFFGQGEVALKQGEQGQVPEHAFEKYVEALDLLVNKLKQASNLPIYIFSHSMGSFITQRYIQRFGNNVDKVVLCGSNGPDGMLAIANIIAKLTIFRFNWRKKAKMFDKLVFGGYSKAIKTPRTSFDWLSINEKNVDDYIADPLCGYGSSKGFYYEFMRLLSGLYRKKQLNNIPKALPILIIAGEFDPVSKNAVGIKKLTDVYAKYGLSNVNSIIYPGLRHEIMNEIENAIVYQDVLTFLNK